MRPINQCLNSRLVQICQKSLQIEALNDLVLSYLSEPAKSHCRVGNFSNGCLTLIVDDPVWASQVRFLVPELRDTLRSQAKLYQLSSIKISIPAYEETIKHTTKPRKATLSTKAKQAIVSEAHDMQDGALKEALYKLAEFKKHP